MEKHICGKLLSCFEDGHFVLDDSSRPEIQSGFDKGSLKDNPRQSTLALVSTIDCDQLTMVHLDSMGKVQKLDIWVPPVLNQSMSTFAPLLIWHHLVLQHEPFLFQIVSADEKLGLFVNVKYRKE